MSCILNIDTSTDVCSVAVSQDGACIYYDEDKTGPNHAEKLGVFVDEAMSFADSHAIPFDAVAVSCVPGSYTGLRIGVSMAKGVCVGQDLKLVAVPTLELLCVPVLLRHDDMEDNALLCPMIDARRMEVYAAIYDRSLREVREIGADVVTADTYREYLDRGPVYFFGNGAAKCMDVINHPNAHLIEGIVPEGNFSAQLIRNVGRALREQLAELTAEQDMDILLQKRYEKFRKVGVFRTINQESNEGV